MKFVTLLLQYNAVSTKPILIILLCIYASQNLAKQTQKTIFKPLVMQLRNTFLLYHMLIFIQNEPKK